MGCFFIFICSTYCFLRFANSDEGATWNAFGLLHGCFARLINKMTKMRLCRFAICVDYYLRTDRKGEIHN